MQLTEYLAYDKIIIVRYPGNAGGKFLINCLGLSNQVVLQDNQLAQLQVSELLSPQEKFFILLDKLNQVTDTWNDLNLGCSQLFIENYVGKLTQINPIIKKVMDSNLFVCMVAHNDRIFKNILNTWPNAKIIYFTNYDLFIDKYRSFASRKYQNLASLLQFWSMDKKQNWPDLPPASIQALESWPEHVMNELYSGKYNHIIDLIFDEQEQNKHYQSTIQNIKFLSSACHWVESFDVGCYLDCDSVIKEVERIYQALDLKDFNKDYILQYYKKWIQVLDSIQHKTLTKDQS
jgi:hypothetical protein